MIPHGFHSGFPIHFATGIGRVLCGANNALNVTFASPEIVECWTCQSILAVRRAKDEDARRAAQWDADEAAGLHTAAHGYAVCG